MAGTSDRFLMSFFAAAESEALIFSHPRENHNFDGFLKVRFHSEELMLQPYVLYFI